MEPDYNVILEYDWFDWYSKNQNGQQLISI